MLTLYLLVLDDMWFLLILSIACYPTITSHANNCVKIDLGRFLSVDWMTKSGQSGTFKGFQHLAAVPRKAVIQRSLNLQAKREWNTTFANRCWIRCWVI